MTLMQTRALAFAAHGREDRKIDRRFLMASVADSTERRDALVERLFMNAIGAFDLFSVYVGERLGLYRVMAIRSSDIRRARASSRRSRAVRT